VVDDHEHCGANRCYEEAIKIKTRSTELPKQIRKKTANDCPNNT
jgi:hypothetical protein